jgi:hypothetical protein
MVDGKAANISKQVIRYESHPQRRLLFRRKSYEIASLVEEGPLMPLVLKIRAFSTLLCIQVPPSQHPPKEHKYSLSLTFWSTCILFFFWQFGLELGRHGSPRAHMENDATRPKMISKNKIDLLKPHRYTKQIKILGKNRGRAERGPKILVQIYIYIYPTSWQS